MTGTRKVPGNSKAGRRKTPLDRSFDGELIGGELIGLEELDVVSLDEVPTWRIDRALRDPRQPRE